MLHARTRCALIVFCMTVRLVTHLILMCVGCVMCALCASMVHAHAVRVVTSHDVLDHGALNASVRVHLYAETVLVARVCVVRAHIHTGARLAAVQLVPVQY